MLKIIIPMIIFSGLIIPVYATSEDIPLNVEPIRIWDEYQIIFDGEISNIVNYVDSKEHHIQVSHYFKSMQKFDSIIAYGDTTMKKGDRALFLIYDNGQNFQISEYSIPITKYCQQMEIMHLVTIPNISLDSSDFLPGIVNHDSCLPEQFGLMSKDIISPTQNSLFIPNQLHKNESSMKINCSYPLEMIFKYDKTPACVKSDSKQKLLERGWFLN